MRVDFYRRFGGSRPPHGYGNSELAFLAWEIRRGVLNRVDDPELPGSPWWRAVNRTFNLHSELAGAMWEAGAASEPGEVGAQPDGLPAAVAHWTAFLAEPSRRTWYVAHTESIAAGVEQAAPLLEREPAAEQAFVGLVLRRLRLVQRLVVSGAPGVAQLADPRSDVVRRLTSNPLLYPLQYPHPGQVRRRAHPAAAPAALLFDTLERGASRLQWP